MPGPGKRNAAKRMRFAEEYAKDLNGTQAAIRAGYSLHTARQIGSRLLTKVDIRDRVAEILSRAAAKNEISVERTMQQIARLAYGDIRRLYDGAGKLRPIHELDDDAAALVASVEQEELYVGSGEERRHIGVLQKVRMRDPQKALDQCMSILAMHKTINPAEAGGLNLHIYPSTYKRPK